MVWKLWLSLKKTNLLIAIKRACGAICGSE